MKPVDVSDCWNRIGVGGDASCPELEEFIQCRNCPVYTKIGLQLLNRPAPPGYRRQWTEYFAESRKPAPTGKTAVVIFRVGIEWLALPTRALQEVAEPRPIHSIPHRRHGVVLGLVNVRGELLLCVSVGRLLGLDHGTPFERLPIFYPRLLVAIWDGKRLVFPSHEVHGVHHLPPEDLAQPPTTITKAALTFTRGVFPWREKMVGLLEPESVFSTLNCSLS